MRDTAKMTCLRGQAVPAPGRDSALRCPRRRAQRQTTKSNVLDAYLAILQPWNSALSFASRAGTPQRGVPTCLWQAICLLWLIANLSRAEEVSFTNLVAQGDVFEKQ